EGHYQGIWHRPAFPHRPEVFRMKKIGVRARFREWGLLAINSLRSRNRALTPIFSLAAVLVGALLSQPAAREQAGKLPDGSFLLPSGWRIRPVGTQIPLDTLPLSTALAPGGKHLLVLHSGYRPPSIAVFETASMKEIGRLPLRDAWLGLAFA